MAKKILKILAIIVGCLIGLNIILMLLFTLPAVQKYAADVAISKLQPRLGTDVKVDAVRIKFFNKVELGGVYVADQQNDTLLFVDRLAVRLNGLDLLKNRVSVNKLELHNFVADVNRPDTISPYNFQFIIDAFAPTDTLKEKKKSAPWVIQADLLEIKNGTLRYRTDSAPETPGKFNANRIDVTNFNLLANARFVSVEDMYLNIRELSLNEHAGVHISDLNGELAGEGDVLSSKRLALRFNDTGLDVSNALFNTATKEFAVKAKSEGIEPRDVAIFVDQLSGLDQRILLDIDADGQLPALNLEKLLVDYGSNTKLDVNGKIEDFKQFKESNLGIDVRQLKTTQSDLQALIKVFSPSYSSPEQLVKLGDLDLKLKADGKLQNFRYDGRLNTQQGFVTLEGIGKITNNFKNIVFEGPVSTNDIQVANIIGEQAGVDDATLFANTKLSIIDGQPLTVTADGRIASVLYKQLPYNDIFFKGTYSGSSILADIRTDSELNKLDLFADLDFGKQKKFDIHGVIDRLDLRPFIQKEDWTNPSLTTRINASMVGDTFDDLVGSLVLDSTMLIDDQFIYNPGDIRVDAFNDEIDGKRLQIYSSVIEGELAGNYHFTTVVPEVMTALHTHLPSVIQAPKNKNAQSQNPNQFTFDFQLKNTEDLSYAFNLPFNVLEPGKLSGNVDMLAEQKIAVNAYLPRIQVGNNDIRETKLKLTNTDLSGLGVNLNTYLVQDNGHISANLNTTAFADSVNNSLRYDLHNNVANSNGQFLISLGFDRDAHDSLQTNILWHPTVVKFNGEDIAFQRSTINFRNKRLAVDNFGIRQQDMLLLGIEGVASTRSDEQIRVYFNDTQVENILSALKINNYRGLLNGNIYLSQLFAQPVIKTDQLRIDDITVFDDPIGTLNINVDWSTQNKGLDLNTHLVNAGNRQLEIAGFVPMGDEEREMDVNVNIKDFALRSVQPALASVFSELSGSINADVKVTGKLNAPATRGWLGINDGVMKVAYTGVTYSISDTIRVEKSRIGMDNLTIRDDNGHTAHLSVNLQHANFGRMAYRVGLEMDDFMLLNNPDRTDLMAYGNLKLSGKVDITGSSAGIYGNARLNSSSKSDVTIVLPQTAQAKEYGGVIYINNEEPDTLSFLKKKDGKGKLDTKVKSSIPINIQANVNLTPLLDVGVILNPTTGDALDVNGNAQLAVNFNTQASPSVSVVGDYVIADGSFRYSLESIKSVNFNIREGSTVTLIGDPLSSQFNIVAYDRVNADLSTLHPSFRAELTNTRVPVDALLEIQGNLNRLNLNYDIDLPESPNDIVQRVSSFISTEEERIRQFAALILTQNFNSSEDMSNLNIGTEMFTSMAANTLSRGLDVLFANALSDNWSINTTFESQDATFDNTRMGVDVSTRLFDDRLQITGNFSYGDNSMLATNQEFLTEFTALWKLNNWLMLRAYNQGNDRFYRRAPYTQGLGVVVTKEAKTLYDLFRFNFKRKEDDNEDTEGENNTTED